MTDEQFRAIRGLLVTIVILSCSPWHGNIYDRPSAVARRNDRVTVICARCRNTGWVCEEHDGRPRDGPHACDCGAAGGRGGLGAMRNQDALAQEVERRHSRMQGPHRAPEKSEGASLSNARAETVEE
jgi:hypothetical protein